MSRKLSQQGGYSILVRQPRPSLLLHRPRFGVVDKNLVVLPASGPFSAMANPDNLPSAPPNSPAFNSNNRTNGHTPINASTPATSATAATRGTISMERVWTAEPDAGPLVTSSTSNSGEEKKNGSG
ncbi:hypothetical protein PMIN03_012821 [Paraphaeosphaeria minitans]